MIHIYDTIYQELLNKTLDCINVYAEEIQGKSHEYFFIIFKGIPEWIRDI